MSPPGGITRRRFLKVAGAGTAGTVLLGSTLVGPEYASYLPSGGSRMNVVVVLVDSLRRDHVGAYGNDRIRTPNLDALAKESLLFTRAYPESVPSIPARRGIHTGIRSFPFRDWQKWSEQDVGLWGWQPIPRDQTTLAEMLAEEGYYNLFVTDTLHQFRPFYDFHRGFHAFHFVRGQERDLFRPRSREAEKRLEGVLIGGPKATHARDIMHQYFSNTAGREREEDWFTPQVFGKAMEFLESARENQPFFLVVDNYDPHEPWDPPERYLRIYGEGYGDYGGPEPMIPSSGSSDWLEPEQLERMRALYSGEVTMMDRWLGNFLDRLDSLGLTESTLLIFLSDHGHAFGEHGYAGKVAGALYPELIDIPFMIRHPGGRGAGRRSDYFASTHDIAPTVLGMLGVEPPGPVDGQDLSVIFEGKDPERERPHFTLAYHDHVWARDEDYAMFSGHGADDAHLFDLRSDPGMDRNLAGGRPDLVKRMYEGYVLRDAGGPLPSY
ncbi:MAG: sulfatase-like hydrolase/transferase [Actinomycetota bacterium]